MVINNMYLKPGRLEITNRGEWKVMKCVTKGKDKIRNEDAVEKGIFEAFRPEFQAS